MGGREDGEEFLPIVHGKKVYNNKRVHMCCKTGEIVISIPLHAVKAVEGASKNKIGDSKLAGLSLHFGKFLGDTDSVSSSNHT